MAPHPVDTSSRPPASLDGTGDLTRLLSTEARLEQRLRDAQEEAAALVAGARERAAAREASLAAELEAEERRLDAAIAEDRRRREAEVAERAVSEARAFDAMGDDRIQALARFVVERVIGAGS